MKKVLSILLALCMVMSVTTATVSAASGPSATSISSVTAKVKGFKVKWNTRSNVDGYQVQYGTKSSFSNAKKVTVSGKSTASKTVTGLKSKQKYYIRVRTYKKKNGSKVYSTWSAKRSVTTKASSSSSQTVYITKTGKKYHCNNHCNGGTYYKSTLAEAKRMGLTPCKKCYNL